MQVQNMARTLLAPFERYGVFYIAVFKVSATGSEERWHILPGLIEVVRLGERWSLAPCLLIGRVR